MGTRRGILLLLTIGLVGCGGEQIVGEATETAQSGSEGEPEPEPSCVALALTPVDHVAFAGHGCYDASDTSTVLSTQIQVDGHADLYCQQCCSNCNPMVCEPPALELGSAIVYAHVNTGQGEAALDILSVEDCGETLVVTALQTVGCEAGFDVAWDSVVVESEATSIELVIVAGPDQCTEPP